MAPQPSHKVLPADPNTLSPHSAAEFLARGWLYYAQQNHVQAEADFRSALSLAPADFDALYSLGMAQSAANHPTEAALTFEQALALTGTFKDPNRTTMLRRILTSQIHRLKTGSWS